MIRHYLKLLWKRKGKNAFLFAELVLVLWVLIGTFSLGMHKFNFYSQPLGFDWEGMYRIYYSEKLDSLALDRMKRELLSFPEVEGVSFSVNVAPYLGNTWGNGNDLNGMNFNSFYLHADEDYAKTWNIPFHSGHFYTKEELAGRYTPIVVNKLFVDRYLQGKEPLGYRFQFWAGTQVEIVGVMKNFRFQGDFEEESPTSIIPLNNRVSKDCISIRTVKGSGPIVEKKLNDFMASTLKSSEFGIVKVADQRSFKNKQTYIPLGIVGSIALFLMVNIILGLFGILRYNIARRVPEIGLRKALGASSADIRRQFTGEMMVLTLMAFFVALVFAVQVPFLFAMPWSKGIYFTAIGLAAVLIFGLVYFCSLAPSHQAAVILPAKALHEE
jgi:putative ABC transport system permease protein